MPEPVGRAPLGDPPPRPWRRSARLLVHGPEGILLLRATDPGWPAQGEWWELPGGGIEAGETVPEAACREVREETGYLVPPESVEPVRWRGAVTYSWFGRRHWSIQEVAVARLAATPPRTAISRTAEEQATFHEVRWLPLPDLAGRRLFPELAAIDLLVADEPIQSIDAGYTVWS